jgi:hypothetical protein
VKGAKVAKTLVIYMIFMLIPEESGIDIENIKVLLTITINFSSRLYEKYKHYKLVMKRKKIGKN